MYGLDGTPLQHYPPPTNSNFSLLSILQREKITCGANYLNWMRNLRISLRYDDREYVLDNPIHEIDEFSID